MAVVDGNILACTFPADSTDVGLGKPTGVVKIDQSTGVQSVLNNDNFWEIPAYIAQGPNDFIYVTNARINRLGQIYRIALQTGVATLLSDGGLLDFPTQLIYLDGWLYVDCVGQNADGSVRRILRVDPVTGAQTIITDNFGGSLSVIVGMTPAPNNALYIADEPGNFAGMDLGSIYKVSIADGSQVQIASGGFFSHPSDLAIDAAGNLLLMNTGGLNDQFLGRVFKVNPNTGQQTLVGDVGIVAGLDAIALAADGTIYLGSIKTQSVPPRIYSMNPNTGSVATISEGQSLSETEGIAVYLPAKFTTPPPTGNLPVTVNLAKAGNPFQSANTPGNMMRCPICNLALTKHVTSGAAPNQMVTWNCVSGHSGIMHEQT